MRDSASLFLEAQHPLEASKSLEIAKLYKEAGDLWSNRSIPEKAALLYEKGAEYILAKEQHVKARQYNEAAAVLRKGEAYEELVVYLGE